MRRADEVDQRIRREYRASEGLGRERVPQYELGAGRHAARALRACQSAYSVAAPEQHRDQGPAHVTGRAGDEDATPSHYLRFLARFATRAGARFLPALAAPPRDPLAWKVLNRTTTLSTRKSSMFAAVAPAARMRRMLFSCSTPGWMSMTWPFHLARAVR